MIIKISLFLFIVLSIRCTTNLSKFTCENDPFVKILFHKSFVLYASNTVSNSTVGSYVPVYCMTGFSRRKFILSTFKAKNLPVSESTY